MSRCRRRRPIVVMPGAVPHQPRTKHQTHNRYGDLMPQQIFAFSGVLQSPGGRSSLDLVKHAVSLTGIEPGAPVHVCYIPTAVGDSPLAIAATAERFGTIPGLEFSVLTLF